MVQGRLNALVARRWYVQPASLLCPYVHLLCRRFLHHCYRSLATVAGRASSWLVRVGRDARAELGAMIEFLRASDELVGATPALTRLGTVAQMETSILQPVEVAYQ
jgi:hypothetical protein